ncbi:MAG TPA: GNAT family N-acetyltransferase [Candidatus Polarisedimenticolia bacterium]|jgi:GNAT superfamily N-acetyltransferase
MRIEPLGDSGLAELSGLFDRLGMRVAPENLLQFSLPRAERTGYRVVTLVMRDAGRIVGTIGYLDLPLRIVRGRGPSAAVIDETARWPVNQYLLPDYRGRGLGKDLMEATRDGARCRIVIGGNAASIPILDRTGYRMIGHLSCWRWLAPVARLLDPRRLRDRMRRDVRGRPPEILRMGRDRGRIEARRADRLTGWLPWASPGGGASGIEVGVPREGAGIEFAFGGALRRHHLLHSVHVDGALAGFFALAARAGRRGTLAAEIVDLDSVPGREGQTIRAALGAAFACADIVRLRISGERFTRALGVLSPRGRQSLDHPVRISCEPGSIFDEVAALGARAWRLTYGDHDQYRVRAASQSWEGA